jgi:hypothetical protein
MRCLGVAARRQVYAKATPVTPNTPGTEGWTPNATFGDLGTAILVHGYSNDGLVGDGGCCAVNCSNVNHSRFPHVAATCSALKLEQVFGAWIGDRIPCAKFPLLS